MRHQQSDVFHLWIAFCILRANGAYGNHIRPNRSAAEEEGSIYCRALRKRNFPKVNTEQTIVRSEESSTWKNIFESAARFRSCARKKLLILFSGEMSWTASSCFQTAARNAKARRTIAQHVKRANDSVVNSVSIKNYFPLALAITFIRPTPRTCSFKLMPLNVNAEEAE